MRYTRRRFLVGAAGMAAGAAWGMEPIHAENVVPSSVEMPLRTLGRIGKKVSILGMGMAPLGSSGTSFAEAEKVVRAAIDLGVTYIDVSPDYGNAEDKLKDALKGVRDRVFLVTKVNPQEGDSAGVQRQVERSLKRMGVEFVDAVHIHNLGDFNMETVLTEGGALGGLKEARRRGLLRFIGTSGHMRPARFVTALVTGDIDLTMNALNFADRHTYDFEGLVLPAAQKQRAAVVAMKVLGGAVGWRYDGRTPATLAQYHSRAIRYSLGLPGVCTAVVGLSNVEEVQKAVEAARSYQPLSSEERTALLSEGLKLANARGRYYGPVEG